MFSSLGLDIPSLGDMNFGLDMGGFNMDTIQSTIQEATPNLRLGELAQYKDTLSESLGELGTVYGDKLDAIEGSFVGEYGDKLEALGGGLQDKYAGALGGLQDKYAGALGGLQDKYTGALGDIQDKHTGTLGDLKDKYTGTLEDLKGGFGDTLNSLKNTLNFDKENGQVQEGLQEGLESEGSVSDGNQTLSNLKDKYSGMLDFDLQGRKEELKIQLDSKKQEIKEFTGKYENAAEALEAEYGAKFDSTKEKWEANKDRFDDPQESLSDKYQQQVEQKKDDLEAYTDKFSDTADTFVANNQETLDQKKEALENLTGQYTDILQPDFDDDYTLDDQIWGIMGYNGEQGQALNQAIANGIAAPEAAKQFKEHLLEKEKGAAFFEAIEKNLVGDSLDSRAESLDNMYNLETSVNEGVYQQQMQHLEDMKQVFQGDLAAKKEYIGAHYKELGALLDGQFQTEFDLHQANFEEIAADYSAAKAEQDLEDQAHEDSLQDYREEMQANQDAINAKQQEELSDTGSQLYAAMHAQNAMLDMALEQSMQDVTPSPASYNPYPPTVYGYNPTYGAPGYPYSYY